MPTPHAVQNGQTTSATTLDSPRHTVAADRIGNMQTQSETRKDPGQLGISQREYQALIGAAAASNDVLVTHPLGSVANSGTLPELAALYQCRINGAARTVTAAALAGSVVTLTIDGAALASGDEIDLTFTNDGKLTFVAGGRVPDFRDLQAVP